jgi:hypothetical protein
MKYGIPLFFFGLVLVLNFTGCGNNLQAKKSGGDETTNGFTALVLGFDGKPAASARVSVHPVDYLFSPGNTTGNISSRNLDLSTDLQGLISIDTMPPGEYRLVVTSGTHSSSWIQTMPGGGKSDTVQLRTSAVLQGTVPLPEGSGAVYVTAQGSEIWSLVQSDGTYEMAGLPLGDWVVSAIHLQQGIIFAQDSASLTIPGDTLTGKNLEPLSITRMEWSDSAWIIVDTRGLGLSGAIDSFPLLLDLSDSLYPVGLSPAATDLRIVDVLGKDIPFEISLWIPAEQRLRIQFLAARVPASDSIQVGRVKWGNPAALAPVHSLSVFDSSLGWSGVWHLLQWRLDSLGRLRAPASVPGALDGVVHGSLSASPRGVWFDGSDQHIAFPPLSLDLGAQDWTMDFWIRPEAEGICILNRSPGLDAWNHRQKAIYLGNPDSSASIETGLFPAMIGSSNVNGYSFAGSELLLNDFQQVTLRRRMVDPDSGKVDWFINGQLVSAAFPDSLNIWDPDEPLDSLFLGGTIFTRGMQGWIRELGISSLARSDDWIRLRYYSTKILASNRIAFLVR